MPEPIPEIPIEIIEETNGTFSAWVPSVPGVMASADTREEVERAIGVALEFHRAAQVALAQTPGEVE